MTGAARLSVAMVVGTMLIAGGGFVSADAATPLEEAEQLSGLCELGAPDVGEDEDDAEYHRRRREAIHRVYETSLPELDGDLVRYDRVGGLMTISGFRTYRPESGGPAIQFRNECLLSFEVGEKEAHDLMAQLQMGTVEVEIGYTPIARRDYDWDFCPVGDDGTGRLQVELLYARLVDTERDEHQGGRVLDTYYTSRGHQWVLRRQKALMTASPGLVPEIEVSDIQWRPTEQGWADDFGESGPPRGLEELEPDLRGTVEQTVYPCYLRGLTNNPSLQGALVVGIPVGDGTANKPTIMMDTLHDSEVRRCVEQRLDDLELVESSADEQSLEAVDAWKATVLMRRR